MRSISLWFGERRAGGDRTFGSVAPRFKAMGALAIAAVFYGCGPSIAAETCLASIKTQLDSLSDQMKEVGRQPLIGEKSGRPVPPGMCTKLVARIGGDFGFYPAFQAESDRNNAVSCLELKRILLRRQCECTAKGETVSTDNETIDGSLDASERLAKAQAKYRSKAIRNPLIAKLVDEASKVRDCYSRRTIEILNATASTLERAIEPPAPTTSAEPATTVKTAKIDGGMAPTTVQTSKADGGMAPTTVRTSKADGGVAATTVRTSAADGGAAPSSGGGGGGGDGGLGSIVTDVLGIAGAALQGYSAGQRAGGTVYVPSRPPARAPAPSNSGDWRPGQSGISGNIQR